MPYSKNLGPLVISESGGVASLSLNMSESAGGGPLAGVAVAQVSASIQVSAAVLIDAALALAAEKFPSAALLIDGLKAAIDAEIAKA